MNVACKRCTRYVDRATTISTRENGRTVYTCINECAPPTRHRILITLLVEGDLDAVERATKASLESGAVQAQISDAADDLGLDELTITEADYEVRRG